jgi:AICAR transformylase/IMP cyclohydrolase PurH
MTQRTDPSSISFGRLLRQTAATVQQQQAEIAELKKGQLSEQEKAQAKQLAAERKQERLRASQMIASYDTTPDDYLSLDQSLLTTAQREQIRHNQNAQMSAGISPLPILDRDAVQRIQNMREASRLNGGAFVLNPPACCVVGIFFSSIKG